jgi:hypothetical protein
MPGGSLESVFLEVTRDPDAVEAAVDETDRAQEPAE